MLPGAVRRLSAAFLIACLGVAGPARAQHASPAGTQPTQTIVREAGDADVVRQELAKVLEKYPPSLPRVLKLDPTLMGNQAYLASYPELAAFLAANPQVAHNPAYYLERFRVLDTDYTADPEWRARQHFDNMVGNFTAFLVFVVVTGVLIWLIRLFVDHRRWNRLSKVQTDVHTKLLDRFTSNEDLLAYIQTSPGKRFLESAPIQIHDDAKPIGAPFARILWSVQVGVVLALAGIGVLVVSSEFTGESAQFFFVVGSVTLALGAGFILSAAAAYLLSRRFGLLERPNADHA